MPFKHTQFPTVRSQHVEGARLFANRKDMIRDIAPRGGVVAEVGVAIGDFSEFLLDVLKPSEFHAIDTFEIHLLDTVWGVPSAELLKGKTHVDFYKDRFFSRGNLVTLGHGNSQDMLAKYSADTFDLIYVDAGHDYEDAKGDANEAVRTIKKDGMIIFNDYTIMDPFLDAEYGVVQAVNELLDTDEWRVVGFALEKNMFCDIAVTRRSL